jgi:hypothetical protein
MMTEIKGEKTTSMSINGLRGLMGTEPISFSKYGKRTYGTVFLRGVEGITVKLIGFTDNPYKDMYTLATSCWGDKIDKWHDTEPEYRFLVVKAVLEKRTLPLPLESAQFTFAVENVSRWAFDQHARQRLGVVFSSMGTRDNDHRNIGFRVHEALWKKKKLRDAFMKQCLACKKVYVDIVDKGKGSWQTARSILPISCLHRYSFSANYAALQSFCAHRMKFCEAEDIVAVAWLVREEMKKKFPLLACYLRPGCDFTKKCDYHKSYSLSEAFGCLFKSCGRHRVYDEKGNVVDDSYQQFNESCSDSKTIAEQLLIRIPDPSDTDWFKLPETLLDLDEKDARKFEED